MDWFALPKGVRRYPTDVLLLALRRVPELGSQPVVIRGKDERRVNLRSIYTHKGVNPRRPIVSSTGTVRKSFRMCGRYTQAHSPDHAQFRLRHYELSTSPRIVHLVHSLCGWPVCFPTFSRTFGLSFSRHYCRTTSVHFETQFVLIRK